MRPRPRRPQTTARAMIAPFPMWWPVVVDAADDGAAAVFDGWAAAVLEETVEVIGMADVDGIAVVVGLGGGDVVAGAEVNDVVNKDDEKGAEVLYTIELGVGATTEGVAIT